MAYRQIISLIDSRLSNTKANLLISLTAICIRFSIAPWLYLGSTNLEEKSNGCPREYSIYWIILNSGISNLFEKVNLLNDFGEKVPKDDCLSALPLVTPSLTDTLLS
jgi:hypothetical protein